MSAANHQLKLATAGRSMSNGKSVNNLSMNSDENTFAPIQKSSLNVSTNFQSFGPAENSGTSKYAHTTHTLPQRGFSVQPVYQSSQNNVSMQHLDYNEKNNSYNDNNNNISSNADLYAGFDSRAYDLYSSRQKFPSYNSLSFESINNASNYNTNNNVYSNYTRNFMTNRTHLNRLNEGLVDKELLNSKSQQYLSVNLLAANDRFSSSRAGGSGVNVYANSMNQSMMAGVGGGYPHTPLNLSYTNLRSPSPVPISRSFNNNNNNTHNSIANSPSSSLIPLNNIAILQQQLIQQQQQQQHEQFSGVPHGYPYFTKS